MQVQMHMTAKIIAEKLLAKAKNSKVFTRHFSYDTSANECGKICRW